jgi:hypothetical protein
MKTTRTQNLIAAALVGALPMSGLATPALAQETHFDKLANLPFEEGRPTKETAQTLRDDTYQLTLELGGAGPVAYECKRECNPGVHYMASFCMAILPAQTGVG